MNKNNSDLTESTIVMVDDNEKTVTAADASNETKVEENEIESESTDNDESVTDAEIISESDDTDDASSSDKEESATEGEKTEKEVERKVPEVLANDTPPLAKKDEKPLALKYLDIDFVFDCLSVPTHSSAEYRMVTFIMMWAKANNVKIEFDTYGNVYLTKGEIAEGECYPCVTSHLDTVQTNQELYAQLGMPLPLKERINTKGGHELYVEGMGIGADDKAGVLISLTLFKYCDKLKACFFLEEEIGMLGSKQLNKEWFDNVGYVIGWDSPDRNRAAYCAAGELLFGKEFFELIEDTCKEHGLTDFRSEPYTDVVNIRSKTQVVCMNFGNGGYNAHASTEYVIIEDIDAACGLGVALIEKLGTEKFRMPSKRGYSYGANADEDAAWLNKRFNKYTTTSAYSGKSSGYTGYNSQSNKSTTSSSRTTNTFKAEDKVDSKVIEYIITRYEKAIKDINVKVEVREAKILADIKVLCEGNEELYNKISKLFDDNPPSEPFSTAIEF